MYPESKHSEHLSNHLAPNLATIPSFTALSFHTWRVILTPSSRGHYWWRFFIDGFVFRSAHSGSLSNPLSVSNTKQMSQETAWFQPCINYASSCSVFEKRLKIFLNCNCCGQNFINEQFTQQFYTVIYCSIYIYIYCTKTRSAFSKRQATILLK